jgi:hypothetical protein
MANQFNANADNLIPQDKNIFLNNPGSKDFADMGAFEQ